VNVGGFFLNRLLDDSIRQTNNGSLFRLRREAVFIIASRIARGLAYAHAKTDKDGKPLGIVHRDINLKNVMIAFEGDVKITDFGIAKARGLLQDQEGEVVAGKVDYMSPEQSNFQITDKRSDIFSVGIVLAQLLLGHNIFKGASMSESRDRVQNMPIPDFKTLDPRIDEPLTGFPMTPGVKSLFIVLRSRMTGQARGKVESLSVLQMEKPKVISPQQFKPEPIGSFVAAKLGLIALKRLIDPST